MRGRPGAAKAVGLGAAAPSAPRVGAGTRVLLVCPPSRRVTQDPCSTGAGGVSPHLLRNLVRGRPGALELDQEGSHGQGSLMSLCHPRTVAPRGTEGTVPCPVLCRASRQDAHHHLAGTRMEPSLSLQPPDGHHGSVPLVRSCRNGRERVPAGMLRRARRGPLRHRQRWRDSRSREQRGIGTKGIFHRG